MGYRAPLAVFPIDTSGDSILEGLDIRIRRPSIETIGDMMQFSNMDMNNLTQEDVNRIQRVFTAFTAALVSWNLEEDVLDEKGDPTGEVKSVPATTGGVRSQDGNFILLIILAWVRTVTGAGIVTSEIPMQTTETETGE